MPSLYPQTAPTNTLFYGDNLDILREYIGERLRGGQVQVLRADVPTNGNFASLVAALNRR